MSTEYFPQTLAEAIRYFSDPDVCLRAMVALRWPNGVTCPRCGSQVVTFLVNARVWKCRTKHDQQKFSVKTGTVMEDSPLALD
ncbi:MAG TPA: transposase, partial [Candidatus Binatia bacterium]|nr:transposase [Candidatus Binatia bacterium]